MILISWRHMNGLLNDAFIWFFSINLCMISALIQWLSFTERSLSLRCFYTKNNASSKLIFSQATTIGYQVWNIFLQTKMNSEITSKLYKFHLLWFYQFWKSTYQCSLFFLEYENKLNTPGVWNINHSWLWVFKLLKWKSLVWCKFHL